MRDSSLRLGLLAGVAAGILGFGAPAGAQEPIVLSNDLSMPTQPLKPAAKKPFVPGQVIPDSPAPSPTSVPMAARPEAPKGSARPPQSINDRAGEVSPPVIDAASVDQIEAALMDEVRAAPAAPPVPLQQPVSAVSPPTSVPPPPAMTGSREPALAPVLRADAPALAAPAASAVPEVAPPTLRISAERFVPGEATVPKPVPASPAVAAPLPLAAQPVLQPEPTRLPEEGVAVEPRPALPYPSAPEVAAVIQPTPASLSPVSPAATPGPGHVSLPPASVAQGVASTPTIQVPKLPVPQIAPAPAKPRLVVEGPQGMAAAAPAKTATAPVHIVDTFRARKGESLRDVIRRWSDRAGIDLVWAMPTDIILEREYSYVGKFETALNNLISAYPQSGLKTTFVDQGPREDLADKPYVAESAPPAVPPVPVEGAELAEFIPPIPAEAVMGVEPAARTEVAPDPVSVRAPMPPSLSAPVSAPSAQVAAAFGPSGRWRALSGASMREVLSAWAEESGIPLIWAARQDFAVRYSVNAKADYGRAVSDLLGQYAFEPTRPVGQIYKDPATGLPLLVVRSTRG